MASLLRTLRMPRIAGIALFDLTSGLLGVILFIRICFPSRPIHFTLAWATVLTLPIGILFHIIFNVPTMLNFYLGISGRPTT
jgi:hypothetical protein